MHEKLPSVLPGLPGLIKTKMKTPDMEYRMKKKAAYDPFPFHVTCSVFIIPFKIC